MPVPNWCQEVKMNLHQKKKKLKKKKMSNYIRIVKVIFFNWTYLMKNPV